MKNQVLLFLMLPLVVIILLSACYYNRGNSTAYNRKSNSGENQQFLDRSKIINNLVQAADLKKENINQSNLWVQYVDIDEDSDLELLVSYRQEIHKGYFFIYDYRHRKYLQVFAKPWAVQKMSGKEIITASGNREVHRLISNIIHMERGRVRIMWSAIIEEYDYTNPLSGTELHGDYYIDTNSVLHYCYKIEKTDKDAKVLKRDFKEQLFVWDAAANSYIRIQ